MNIRQWIRGASLLVLLLAISSLPANAQRKLVTAVDAIGITVSDMDRAVDFYSKALSFEKVSDVEVAGSEWEQLQGLFGLRMHVVRMALGDEAIELTEYLAPEGRMVPEDSRSNDRWFQHIAIIVSDMDRAYQHLRSFKVRHASSGPQRLPDWNPNAGGIKAFYFKDPDGHVLEILQFPAGKGNPKWAAKAATNASANTPFLGIDHTAIVVENTDESLKFYRDMLGLEVAGTSENYGTEQEHLNNVFGAHLRITSLRPAAGPSIEFLEYIAPRDGRPYPDGARASDLYQWQTRLVTTDITSATSEVMSRRYRCISSGPTTLPGGELGFHRGLLVRDPDGHAMQIAQP